MRAANEVWRQQHMLVSRGLSNVFVFACPAAIRRREDETGGCAAPKVARAVRISGRQFPVKIPQPPGPASPPVLHQENRAGEIQLYKVLTLCDASGV
jgi:hypothetical protein